MPEETKADVATGNNDIVVTAAEKPKFNILEAAKTAASAVAAPASTTAPKVRKALLDGAGARINGSDSRIGPYAETVITTAREVNRAERRGKDPKFASARDEFSKASGKVSDSIPGQVAAGIGVPFVGKVQSIAGAGNAISNAGSDGAGGVAVAVTKTGLAQVGNRMGIFGVAPGGVIGAIDAAKDFSKYKKGIELMAEKGVPGFEYQERDIIVDGKPQHVKVWVDASAGNRAPYVVIDDGKGTAKILGSDKAEGPVGEFAKAVQSKAQADRAEFTDNAIIRNGETGGTQTPSEEYAKVVNGAASEIMLAAQQPKNPTMQASAAPQVTAQPASAI